VIRLLADAPVVIRRKIELIDIGKIWTQMERGEIEAAFLELERCIGILDTKQEAKTPRYKKLLVLYSKYNDKEVKKSPETLADLQMIVKETKWATGVAGNYAPDEQVAQDDEGSESEADVPNLLAIAGGSNVGKAALNKGAQQKKVAESAAASKAAADKDAAQYEGLTQKTARKRLTEWVNAEGAQMAADIKGQFERKPETYGGVKLTSPDTKLLAIAKYANADGLYSRIAAIIKAAFPMGTPSHIDGYFYHHTVEQSSKGKAAFNITGHTAHHDPANKSPFNMHITRP
jgi:hypothetical protein